MAAPRRTRPSPWGGAIVTVLALLAPVVRPPGALASPSECGPRAPFQDDATCGGCHWRAFGEHVGSLHANAGRAPAFVAELARLRTGAADERTRASTCLLCHSPVLAAGDAVFSLSRDAEADLDLPGVTCDFCHSVVGHDGEVPGQGNALTCPGDVKWAALPGRDTWHRAYSAFHESSEFCATCHSWRNAQGVSVRSTPEEWRASAAAARGVQCQDCHMSLVGVQVEGRSYFAAGRAAESATVRPQPEREGLHAHEFPGGRSAFQLAAALALSIAREPTDPGGAPAVVVTVSNVGAGHSVPTGAVEHRHLWLEVEADGRLVTASPADPDQAFDVAGATAADADLVDCDVPAGSRIYRAVLAGPDGAPGAPAHAATAVLFDNRLRADEVRRELLTLPAGTPPDAPVRARLRWLARSTAAAKAAGLAPDEPLTVAEAWLPAAQPGPSG